MPALILPLIAAVWGVAVVWDWFSVGSVRRRGGGR